MQTDTIAVLLQTKSGQQLAVRATIGLGNCEEIEFRSGVALQAKLQLAAS